MIFTEDDDKHPLKDWRPIDWPREEYAKRREGVLRLDVERRPQFVYLKKVMTDEFRKACAAKLSELERKHFESDEDITPDPEDIARLTPIVGDELAVIFSTPNLRSARIYWEWIGENRRNRPGEPFYTMPNRFFPVAKIPYLYCGTNFDSHPEYVSFRKSLVEDFDRRFAEAVDAQLILDEEGL